jgi:hypothetical protein
MPLQPGEYSSGGAVWNSDGQRVSVIRAPGAANEEGDYYSAGQLWTADGYPVSYGEGGGGGGGGGGRTPEQVGGVVLHVSANDIDVAHLASIGDEWPSVSGVGLVPADATQPRLRTDSGRYGDLKAVEVNWAAQSNLRTADPLGVASPDLTVVGVLGASLGGRVAVESELAGAAGYFSIQTSGAFAFAVNKGASDAGAADATGWHNGDRVPRIVAMRLSNASIEGKVGRNGGNPVASADPADGNIVDKRLWVGGRSNGSSNCDLLIHELAVFNYRLDDTEYADVIDGFADAWRV